MVEASVSEIGMYLGFLNGKLCFAPKQNFWKTHSVTEGAKLWLENLAIDV